MPYEEKKDRCIVPPEVVYRDDWSRIEIGVYAYNGGDPKIAIRRVGRDDKFYKLGRLNDAEARAVRDGIDRALSRLANEIGGSAQPELPYEEG